MASANPKNIISVVATVSLVASQYCAVTAAGALPAAGGKVVGINQGKGAVGQAVPVATSGTSKALAGGTFAKDDDLTVDANGKLIKAVTAGHRIVARALEAAVSGDVVRVLITNAGQVSA